MCLLMHTVAVVIFLWKGAGVSKEQAGHGGVAGSVHGEGLLFLMSCFLISSSIFTPERNLVLP